jgi:hypothetical protein
MSDKEHTWYLCPYCTKFIQIENYRYHHNGCGGSPDDLPETFDKFKTRLSAVGGVYTCAKLPAVHNRETGEML